MFTSSFSGQSSAASAGQVRTGACVRMPTLTPSLWSLIFRTASTAILRYMHWLTKTHCSLSPGSYLMGIVRYPWISCWTELKNGHHWIFVCVFCVCVLLLLCELTSSIRAYVLHVRKYPTKLIWLNPGGDGVFSTVSAWTVQFHSDGSLIEWSWVARHWVIYTLYNTV